MPILFSVEAIQGSLTSAHFSMPQDASGEWEVRAIVGDLDRQSGKTFRCQIEADLGEGWRPWTAFTWKGPSSADPSVLLPAEELRGKQVRVVVEASAPINLTFSIAQYVYPDGE